ncbi:hypothetical protein [Leptolyngbya ohadii]|uniref:hypothetical protein n=1 Tax=Leptolyngbya ohadii TaxID=1962290 RepID=UPI000B59D73B|nr:hypothetical protein [Leptolyngbya ohadii]
MSSSKKRRPRHPDRPERNRRESYLDYYIDYYIDIVWGIVCGEGHISGRMASGAPGAIDPTERWKPLAEEYIQRGFETREAIAVDMRKRWAEISAVDD